jgi:hypothetical protein
MAGLPEKAAVFADSSPVFETLDGFKGRVLAKYADTGSPLLSGYLIGEKLLAGKAAALEVQLDAGRVILLGFRPGWRGHRSARSRSCSTPPSARRPRDDARARGSRDGRDCARGKRAAAGVFRPRARVEHRRAVGVADPRPAAGEVSARDTWALLEARAYAYGGSVIQDLGYYPFGSHFFTNLLHYVKTGDFVERMIRDAQDVNEYAFALGALCHYASDNAGTRWR